MLISVKIWFEGIMQHWAAILTLSPIVVLPWPYTIVYGLTDVLLPILICPPCVKIWAPLEIVQLIPMEIEPPYWHLITQPGPMVVPLPIEILGCRLYKNLFNRLWHS